MAILTGTELVQSILDTTGIALTNIERQIIEGKIDYQIANGDEVTSLNATLTIMALGSDAKAKAIASGDVDTFVTDTKAVVETSIDTFEPQDLTPVETTPTGTPEEIYAAAVLAAAESKAAADAAALLVTDAATAQTSLDAANTASTDAIAVVAAAANTEDDGVDDATAATAAADALAAVTAATAAMDPYKEITYTIEAAASTVVEGNDLVFIVTASDTLALTDKTITYSITGVETTVASAADALTDIGTLNGTVTILAGETTGTITINPADDSSTEGYEAFKVTLLNDDFTAGNSSANIVIQDAPNSGQFNCRCGYKSRIYRWIR